MEAFTNAKTGERVEIQTVPLFATPVIVTKFPKHSAYNWEPFEKIDRKPKQWFTSVNTSFPETKSDDPYIPQDIHDNLKRDIFEHVQKVLSCYNMNPNVKFSNFWYNAYYEGQGQEPHNHLSQHNLNPFWCGIYFAHNCFPHQLSFASNNHDLRTQQNFAHWISNLKDHYDQLWSSSIPTGHIVLFPPHLTHGIKVGKENRNKMRLTFSFNILIDKQEPW